MKLSRIPWKRPLFAAFSLFLLLSVSPADAAEKGLVGRWIFSKENLTGSTVKDLAGNLEATISGNLMMAHGPDALVLDGAATRITIHQGSPPETLPPQAITVEAWIALYEPMEWGGIIGFLQDNGGFEKGWLLGTRDRHFCFALSTAGADDGDGVLTYLNSETAFEPGVWYHVAGTFDGKEQKIYVNGECESTSQAQSGEINYPAEAFLDIAAYHDENEHYPLSGSLHEVTLFNRAMTPEEIKGSYRKKRALIPEHLELEAGPSLRHLEPEIIEITCKTRQSGKASLEYGNRLDFEYGIGPDRPGKDHVFHVGVIEPEKTYYYRIRWEGPGREMKVSSIYTFDSTSQVRPVVYPQGAYPPDYEDDELMLRYAIAGYKILDFTDQRKGYCLVLGSEEGRLAYEIARHSEFNVIGVEPDAAKVRLARRALDQAGIYGTRVTIIEGSLDALPFPDYFANFIISDRVLLGGGLSCPAEEVFRVLRPCGGTMVLGQTLGFAEWTRLDPSMMEGWCGDLPINDVRVSKEGNGPWWVINRPPLAGAGTWTHTYADPANTACSMDQRVKAPLTLQWFGRPGPRLMIDRHHRNVPPLYRDGRVFVPADDRVIAMDAYNGTWLWDVVVPGSRRLGVFLDTSHLVVDENRLYIAHHDQCSTYDVRDGTPGVTFSIPQCVKDEKSYWSYVARSGDMIFGTGRIPEASYQETSKAADSALWYDSMSIVTSRYFFALDADSGRKRWTYQSGLLINTTLTLGGDRVYFVESHSPAALENPFGRMPFRTFLEGDENYLVALDRKSGGMVFKKKIDLTDCRLIAYLNYAEENLLLSGCRYVDNKLWYFFYDFDASSGKLKWHQGHDSEYDPGGGHGEQNRHPTLVGDKVFAYPYAYWLESGEKIEGYKFSRSGHGCGGVSASAHALFWRGGNPTMGDLRPGGDVEKINHVTRPGCWINIIPAGGMVLIPEASSGCTCAFPLQTSLAYRPR